jgi:hypothetical protein
MTGQSHWIDFIVLLSGVAGVAALLVGSWWTFRNYRDVSRRVACPRNGGLFEATLVWSRKDRKWAGVQRCAAFKDPSHVTCGMDCVDDLNAQSASELVAMTPEQ